jgi:hypothetical protein
LLAHGRRKICDEFHILENIYRHAIEALQRCNPLVVLGMAVDKWRPDDQKAPAKPDSQL